MQYASQLSDCRLQICSADKSKYGHASAVPSALGQIGVRSENPAHVRGNKK